MERASCMIGEINGALGLVARGLRDGRVFGTRICVGAIVPVARVFLDGGDGIFGFFLRRFLYRHNFYGFGFGCGCVFFRSGNVLG